jgi:outer membrane usher protein FimD/PapC
VTGQRSGPRLGRRASSALRSAPAGLALLAGLAAAGLAAAASPQHADEAAAAGRGAAATKSRYEEMIVRVLVNTAARGDIAVLHDGRGAFLVPREAFATWGLASMPAPSLVDGEAYVDLAAVPGIETRFDPATVTLHVNVRAGAMLGTRIDLRPQRRADVVYTDDSSVFLNYGLDAVGDDGFGARRYQAATEFGARLGRWLLYSTSDHAWGRSACSPARSTTTGTTCAGSP